MNNDESKIKRTYSLEPLTVTLIEEMAHQTRRTKSVVVDLAVERLALEIRNGSEKLAEILNQRFRRDGGDPNDLSTEAKPMVQITPDEAFRRVRAAQRKRLQRTDSGDLANAETVDLVEAAAG